MNYQKFQGTLIGWQQLFEQAAAFATGLGPARVRAISHSASEGRGIVTVWFHDETDITPPPPTAIDLELRLWFKRGTLISWDELFRAICAKTRELRAEQVLSISHSDSKGDGIAVLWYWDAAR